MRTFPLALATALAFCLTSGCSDDPDETPVEILRVGIRSEGAPATNATVRFLASSRWREVREPGEAQWETAARCGDPLELDANGMVTIPDHGFVAAWEEDRFGAMTASSRRGGDLALDLEPDRHLHVRVLDAEGLPAHGVPVGLRSAAGADLGRWITDEAGAFDIRHLNYRIRNAKAPHRVTALLPHPEPVEATIPEPEADNLSLQLPPSGTVMVTVLDKDGAPVAGVPVHLEVLRPPTRDTDRAAWLPTATGPAGATVFEWAPLGQRMRARVQRPGFEATVFAGPQAAGDTARNTIQQRPDPQDPDPKAAGKGK